MSRRAKFYKRLKNIPNDIRYEELESFLKAMGFKINVNTGSSHMIVEYNNYRYSIPKHGLVKECYIEKIVEIIEEMGIEVK